MSLPTAPPRPRRLIIALAVAGAILAALIGVGLYGQFLAPRAEPAAEPAPTATTAPGAAPATSAKPATPKTPPTVRSTTDPETFARAVAEALFTWDTATEFGPADYAQIIVDVGDPSGEHTPALAEDVRQYLPTQQAWAQLRTYQTRQWITLDEVAVPSSWADALEQAAPGQLVPGTIAYTIDGVRHRTGTVGTTPMETEHSVAFTVFVACEPTYGECRLLRISQLDKPLR